MRDVSSYERFSIPVTEGRKFYFTGKIWTKGSPLLVNGLTFPETHGGVWGGIPGVSLETGKIDTLSRLFL